MRFQVADWEFRNLSMKEMLKKKNKLKICEKKLYDAVMLTKK